MNRFFLFFLGIILAVALALSLPSRAAAEPAGLNVVVSIYPLRDIVRQVGGDRVRVDVMVPPGATPHTFEPTPSDMVKVQNARMLVIIGAGFEYWAERTIRAAGRKDLKVLVLSEGLPLLHEEGSPAETGGKIADPHIWLDPILVKAMVDKIASTLTGLDGSGRTYYRKRAERFEGELTGLNSVIVAAVRSFRIKEYVTFHPAWNYFSRRYGLKVLGTIEESPGKEPGPKHVARIIDDLRRLKASVVFAEPQFNPKIARVIAKEAGAKVLFLDPIGGPDRQGRDTYVGLMRYNLSVLEEAMK